MAKLALSLSFLDDYKGLEKQHQKRVSDLADKFHRLSADELRNAKGINLEPHKNAADPRARTVRITDNFRGVVLDTGDGETFVLTKIGTHDETDRWMAQNTFRVNEATGALEIRNVEMIAAEVQKATAAASAPSPLFEHRSDKEMVKLGIDEELLPALRAFHTEDQLNAFIGVLPQSQAEAIIELTGSDPVDEIYSRIAGAIEPEEIDTENLAAAVTAPASRGQFHVFTEERELAEVLARPWVIWPTYLHTSQHDAAYRPVYNGPARITGGAGTGKTVVAMHRAKALADQMPPDAPAKSILFTTFTRNLAQAIEHDLTLLGGPELLEKVEVLNVDRVVHRVVTDAEGSMPKVVAGSEVLDLWRDAATDLGSDLSPEFLNHEWEQVILAQECASRSDYFTVSRAGRGVRLDRRGRAEVWKVVERFTQLLAVEESRTYLQLAASAAGYLRGRSVKPYRHVVVDEAQDLHEAQWRMLRAVVPEGANDIFIVGDSHQRIYDRRSSLSKVGINIRGRSSKLRINYRTTHQILSWSLALLGEGSFDDLDEGADSHDFAGYHSYMHGPMPVLSGHDSLKAQHDALVSQVREWVDQGVDWDEIGIAARMSGSLESVVSALDAAGVPTVTLTRDLHDPGHGVRLGTMHRMKGLEFRCVAVVDVDADKVPLPWELTPREVDPVQHAFDLQRECCLLYVACTRAREQLWIGWSGKPSRFLQAIGPDEE
jgi:hypothetical protein